MPSKPKRFVVTVQQTVVSIKQVLVEVRPDGTWEDSEYVDHASDKATAALEAIRDFQTPAYGSPDRDATIQAHNDNLRKMGYISTDTVNSPACMSTTFDVHMVVDGITGAPVGHYKGGK